mmetsp:Transcript_175347/g.562468  ORF Transcript_175347/g.562468 Transcript_175347/m.562468 type:complete len:212 (-) Transcript_175347:1251-1886(-)
MGTASTSSPSAKVRDPRPKPWSSWAGIPVTGCACRIVTWRPVGWVNSSKSKSLRIRKRSAKSTGCGSRVCLLPSSLCPSCRTASRSPTSLPRVSERTWAERSKTSARTSSRPAPRSPSSTRTCSSACPSSTPSSSSGGSSAPSGGTSPTSGWTPTSRCPVSRSGCTSWLSRRSRGPRCDTSSPRSTMEAASQTTRMCDSSPRSSRAISVPR